MIAWLTSAVLAAPDAFAPCEVQARYFTSELRSLKQDPPDLWWILDDPCEGDTFAGAPPPTGDSVWCEDRRSRRHGRQTSFTSGRISLETEWVVGQETGTRHDYNPQGVLVSTTEVRAGERHGEHVEASLSGGITVSSWVRGEQTGPVWHIDASNHLSLVSYWREGNRHGRACTWRDGSLEVDTVWRHGEPEVPEPSAEPPPTQITLTPSDPEEG